MKKINEKMFVPLDDKEKNLMEDIENNEFVSIANSLIKKQIQKAATDKFQEIKEKQKKDAKITIRLNKYDLQQVKKRAEEDGLPYQTLIASIIHRFLNGRLLEKIK